jgi:hypothetical protein
MVGEGTAWVGNSGGRAGGERILLGEEERIMLHIPSVIKPTKCCLKKGEWDYNKEGVLVQGILRMYGVITMNSPCIISGWKIKFF